MKKIFNYALFCILTLGFALSFNACSKDDDDNVVDNASIVGTWEIIASKGWEIDKGDKDEWDWKVSADSRGTERWSFKSDGDFVCSEYDSYKGVWVTEDSGQWKMNGNKLTLRDEEEESVVTIVKLDADVLIMSNYEKEPGYEFSVQNTYKRIK